MNKYLRIGAAVIVVANLSACATITRGSKQKYSITSEPSAASVELSLGQKCVTPCKLKLKRREPFVATFSKEGFETQQVNVRSKVHGGGAVAGVGNVLFGGLIGVGVDASSGAMNDLDPNPLNVTLKAVPAVVPAVVTEPASAADAVAPAADGTAAPVAEQPVAPAAPTTTTQAAPTTTTVAAATVGQ